MSDEDSQIKEGIVLNNYFYRKFMRENKNVLAAVTGPTGSGKSWYCLSVIDKWYKKFFKKPFPKENICFSVEEVMERVVHGNLPEGSFLILEEAGTSMGSLDFQNKVSKLFNYILQSFRSKNIGLFVNLPYFTMLNKQTRMLMHLLIKMYDIDKSKMKSHAIVHHLQWNQHTGKPYTHCPKIMIDGVMEKVRVISYTAPDKEIIKTYEDKKNSFVDNLAKTVLNQIKEQKGEKEVKKSNLTKQEEQVLSCLKNGITSPQKIADFLGKHRSSISRTKNELIKKGIYLGN